MTEKYIKTIKTIKTTYLLLGFQGGVGESRVWTSSKAELKAQEESYGEKGGDKLSHFSFLFWVVIWLSVWRIYSGVLFVGFACPIGWWLVDGFRWLEQSQLYQNLHQNLSLC